jgi:hypothetical protein
MCHVSLLSADQIEQIERWPIRWRKAFERRTDYLTVRDRRGVVQVYEDIVTEMGKSAERILEAATR